MVQKVTWAQFLQAYEDQYCPLSYRYTQEAAFMRLDQGNMSVADYEAKFVELSKYAPDMVNTKDKKCRKFHEELNANVKNRMNPFRERNYADLIDMARQIGKNVQDYRERRKRGRFDFRSESQQSGGQKPQQQRQSQSYSGSQRGRGPREQGRQSQSSGGQSMSRDSSGVRNCFRCGSVDHLVRDCPMKMQTFRCYNCNEMGHIASQCPKPKVNPASSAASVSGGKGKGVATSTAPGRVFAMTRQGADASPDVVSGTVSVYNHIARMLVDPGSTHSFVATLFVEYLPVPREPLYCALAISTPIGEVIIVKDYYPGCELDIGGYTLLVDLVPLPMVDFDIILGMDFLAQYRALVDCFSQEVIF